MKDAEGFIWMVWCKVPSFNKSVSQSLLCNNSSCQLFWKINCLSWIPVKQSALSLWREGEQLCSSSMKSGLTFFVSFSVIIVVHRENVPCAKSLAWAQSTSQLPVQLVCVFADLFNQPPWLSWRILNSTEKYLHLESSSTVTLNWSKLAQCQEDWSCPLISFWRQVFWKSNDHLGHGYTMA